MKYKILLSVSTYKNNAANSTYELPDGNKIDGSQTNEAPVKYLINKYNNPAMNNFVTEVICLVTKEAETAYEHLKGLINGIDLKIAVSKVKISTDQKPNDFIGDVIEHLENGDRILIDATGGFRNFQLFITLFSRIISFTGNEITEMIYAEWNKDNEPPNRITPITDYLDLYNFSEGLKDLVLLGNANTLDKYLKQSLKTDDMTKAMIERLIRSVDSLYDSITLCRPKKIGENINELLDAIKCAESITDPIVKRIIPSFNLGFDESATIPHLIEWYLKERNMISQALTLYVEYMPKYILRDSGLVFKQANNAKRDEVLKKNNNGSDEDYYVLINGILTHSPAKDFKDWIENNQKLVSSYIDTGNWGKIKASYNEELSLLREYILYCGNTNKIDNENLKELINKNGIKTIDKNNLAKISDTLAMDIINLARNKTTQDNHNRIVMALKRINDGLKTYGYNVNCKEEDLRRILEDYLYIKQIRNMTNHASDVGSVDKDLEEYLTGLLDCNGNKRYRGFDPSHIELIDVQYIKTIIQQSLSTINNSIRIKH